MGVILRHIKEHFGQGTPKAKLQKEFFLMEQWKMESINQFAGRVKQLLSDCVHYILADMIVVS